MSVPLEIVLVNGERRNILLAGHMDSVGNALQRLDDWIRTEDGSWIQKRWIVEASTIHGETSPAPGTEEELRDLRHAAGTLADQARD